MVDVEVLRAGLPKRWWVCDGDGRMVGRLWWLVGFRAEDFRQGWDLGILGLGLTEVFFFFFWVRRLGGEGVYVARLGWAQVGTRVVWERLFMEEGLGSVV